MLPHVAEATATVREEHTASEAVAALRAKPLAERIVYFYVLDSARRLVGVVPTRRLLVAGPDDRIRDMMVPRVVSLPARATVLDACEAFVLHRFLALPVVDGEGRLLGTVDVSFRTQTSSASRRLARNVSAVAVPPSRSSNRQGPTCSRSPCDDSNDCP